MSGAWVRDENGALRRETIHHMGRRCRNWDYRCDAVYLITLVLADRSRPIFGRLMIDEPPELARGRAGATAGAMAVDPETVKAHVELSELGLLIEGHWRKIGEFTPEIKPLALQLMPEHLHGVLWVRRNMKKSLGDALRGFKSGATKIYRAWLSGQSSPEGRRAQEWGQSQDGRAQQAVGEIAPSPRGDGVSLFAPGYVDDILFDKQAFENGSAYVLDNARRLAVKRLFPDFFKVLRDLNVNWRSSPEDGRAQLGRAATGGRFAAIGNVFLLRKPTLPQVQCSRSDFRYRRVCNAKDTRELVKDAKGNKIVEFSTAAFDEKLSDLLAAAKQGAVLVSPCVSDGEKEIAARAFAAGASVVTLQNKGFSPLYKPGGQLFERCAAGNLLMLAPIAWPYLPGEKKITRVEALTLNRIAQLICGSGAAVVNYRGAKLGDVDAFVAEAVASTPLSAARRDGPRRLPGVRRQGLTKMKKTPMLAFACAIAFVAAAWGGEFSPAYFWMWNDRLEPAKLKAQLADMRAHGLTSVCVHPWPSRFRPNLIPTSWMEPEYLSPEYLEIYRQAVAEAKSLGMTSWLYDEGGWPSGGAAGQVMDSDPELRFALRAIGNDDPRSDELVTKVVPYASRTGRGSYPSMIEPGATERFLEITHAAYKRTVGEEFGKGIRLAFTDEPVPQTGRTGRWLGISSDFEKEFRERKGYSFASVAAEVRSAFTPWSETYARHRIDYCDVLSDLFVERYVLPLRTWCRKNGLLSSGHFCGDEGPSASSALTCKGALLRNLRGQDAPGIDTIWRQLYPSHGFQPGDEGRQTPIPRYAVSAARQNGSRYVMTESLGVYGNAIPPHVVKWVCDYQLVRGVNKFVFGYYYYTTCGGWMHYLEPTMGPVQPWWDMTEPLHRYVENVAAFLAEGEAPVRTAVYYDQRGFWAGGPDSAHACAMHDLIAKELDRRPCDYDFVDDETIAAATGHERGELCVGKARYDTLYVPTSKWMTPEAKAAIAKFKTGGGRVFGAEDIVRAKPVCSVTGRDSTDIRATKRLQKDGEVRYFLTNESVEWSREVTIRFEEPGAIVRYDPESGRETALARQPDGSLRWTLAAGGSLAVRILPGGAPALPNEPVCEGSSAELKEGWTVRRAVRHALGKDDFEITPVDEKPRPIALGDWRAALGDDFSGKAVYRVTYVSKTEQDAEIDLGKVCWAVTLKVNGETLPGHYAAPYRWWIHLKAGENVIEATVANLLVNALNEREHVRIARDYPPDSVYGSRQVEYDRCFQASGLFGPVRLKAAVR